MDFLCNLKNGGAEMSQSGFVGLINSVGSSLASSDQLKLIETGDSRSFWVKMGDFLRF